MLRSLRLAGLAMLGCLSSATAQRSTRVTLLQGGATIEGPRVP